MLNLLSRGNLRALFHEKAKACVGIRVGAIYACKAFMWPSQPTHLNQSH